MSVVLLDSGVWLAARDRDDPFHEPSLELLRSASRGSPPVGALDLTLYETANVATVKWGSPAEVGTLYDLVLTLAGARLVRIDRELLLAAAATAKRHGLTGYDGAYLACAELHGWQLVSTDRADLVAPELALDPEVAQARFASGD